MTTVLTTAWAAAHSPSSSTSLTGCCCRCGVSGSLVPVRAVVSKVFTAFDDWVKPSGHGGLCPACAWGYQHAALRSHPHLVTRAPAALVVLDRAATFDHLAGGPIDGSIAVIVPLRPGRKHLFPSAGWGRVTLDEVHLPWTVADAELLRLVARLRGRGFGTRMLTEPAPPFPVLRRLPSHEWALTMRDWDLLDPWRTQPSPWLDLALHITTPKE